VSQFPITGLPGSKPPAVSSTEERCYSSMFFGHWRNQLNLVVEKLHADSRLSSRHALRLHKGHTACEAAIDRFRARYASGQFQRHFQCLTNAKAKTRSEINASGGDIDGVRFLGAFRDCFPAMKSQRRMQLETRSNPTIRFCHVPSVLLLEGLRLASYEFSEIYSRRASHTTQEVYRWFFK
jgi:hypothetical protein